MVLWLLFLLASLSTSGCARLFWPDSAEIEATSAGGPCSDIAGAWRALTCHESHLESHRKHWLIRPDCSVTYTQIKYGSADCESGTAIERYDLSADLNHFDTGGNLTIRDYVLTPLKQTRADELESQAFQGHVDWVGGVGKSVLGYSFQAGQSWQQYFRFDGDGVLHYGWDESTSEPLERVAGFGECSAIAGPYMLACRSDPGGAWRRDEWRIHPNCSIETRVFWYSDSSCTSAAQYALEETELLLELESYSFTSDAPKSGVMAFLEYRYQVVNGRAQYAIDNTHYGFTDWVDGVTKVTTEVGPGTDEGEFLQKYEAHATFSIQPDFKVYRNGAVLVLGPFTLIPSE